MKRILIGLSVCLVLLSIAAEPILAWTANSFTTVQIGNYWWKNYDLESEYDPTYTNVDWPISIIYYGPDAEVDAAHAMMWPYTGGPMFVTYHDNYDSWEYDEDWGRKSALLDYDAWHIRIYAETDGDRCTHSTWGYYVVATTHRDYLTGNPQYWGNTLLANMYALQKAEETVGSGDIDEDFVYMSNLELYHLEGASAPYHYWHHDGYADGIYMD